MIGMLCRSRLLLSGSTMMLALAAQTPATAQTLPATAPASAAPLADATAGTPTGSEADLAAGIVVVGNRYQAATLQMRSANTVNVISAQDLEHTAVHNVAEALGMVPGINVMNTGSAFAGGVDGASRGEGMFVSVRGLNSEYNINLINGVSVAQGNPYSRGVQLSLLPPSGLQTIIVNKTSQPDMLGDAIGGTIDFRTPSAFDYAADSRGSVTIGGRVESRARAYGQNGLGWNAGADYSRKFGADHQFGVYVSGFYDIRHFANSLVGGVQESGCCDNGYDFAVQDAAGNSAPGLDPAANLIQTAANFGLSSGYTERFGGNGTFDWRPDEDTSIYLRASYARAKTDQNSQLTQIVGVNKQDGSSGTALGNGTYAPVIGAVQARFWYETNPAIATLGTVQLGMDKHAGKLTVSPSLFYSWGSNARPNHIEVAGRYAPVAYGGSTLFGYDNGYPVPLLPATVRSQLNNISGMPANGGPPEYTPQTSFQRKGGGKIDLKLDFDGGHLTFLKAGFRVETSHREITNRDYTVPGYGNAATLGDLGVIKQIYPAVWPKRYTWQVPVIDQGKVFSLFNQLGGATDATIDTCGSNPINSYNCNTQKANETVWAGYVMGQLQYGNLEIVPGVRYEHTDIKNVFWVTPTDNGTTATGAFGSNKAKFDAVLPSIAFTYRDNGGAVYRASAWTSYVRPPFLQLGGGASTSVSGGVTTITQGNPNLKAIRAINLDASGEWTIPGGGHVMLAGFYKHLAHYIYDNGSSAGIVTGSNAGVTTGTVTYQPQNGGSGHVYGIELQARQKFSALPGLLSGLGVAVNFTRQWTRVDVLGDGTRMDRIQNAPEVMANGQVFFEKGPVSLDVNYSYAGDYVSIYDTLGKNATWDDVWVRPVSRVDVHAGYTFSRMFKLDLSIANLFNTPSYWSHIGQHSLAISDIVNSGTTSLVTATMKF
ncbi:TonB-dependent receptor [Novosphingobium capsulatum]|uniref:TonB-dependent receptor n=1 Tax=Novosphingobium capsulatum TaxID=13688 RepID=A0ABU1MM85_9SPHN|nr:TonB-dependent receptor [Novosphingobium capsulatum]MDR6511131.1 TonB-dependent receptor [Novosphingobium capsulatum]